RKDGRAPSRHGRGVRWRSPARGSHAERPRSRAPAFPSWGAGPPSARREGTAPPPACQRPPREHPGRSTPPCASCLAGGHLADSILTRARPLLVARLVGAALSLAVPMVLARVLLPASYGTFKQAWLVSQTLALMLP